VTLSAVGALERAQHDVAALHGVVERRWAVCWPWKASSISSWMMLRISGMLPRRSPREFSVGSARVSCR
jgi:hypothetical protein